MGWSRICLTRLEYDLDLTRRKIPTGSYLGHLEAKDTEPEACDLIITAEKVQRRGLCDEMVSSPSLTLAFLHWA